MHPCCCWQLGQGTSQEVPAPSYAACHPTPKTAMAQKKEGRSRCRCHPNPRNPTPTGRGTPSLHKAIQIHCPTFVLRWNCALRPRLAKPSSSSWNQRVLAVRGVITSFRRSWAAHLIQTPPRRVARKRVAFCKRAFFQIHHGLL